MERIIHLFRNTCWAPDACHSTVAAIKTILTLIFFFLWFVTMYMCAHTLHVLHAYACRCLYVRTCAHMCAHMFVERAAWLSFIRCHPFLVLWIRISHWSGSHLVASVAAREWRGSAPQCWDYKSALHLALLHGFGDLTQFLTSTLYPSLLKQLFFSISSV